MRTNNHLTNNQSLPIIRLRVTPAFARLQTIAAAEGITDYTAELEYPNEYNLESEDHLIKLLNRDDFK